MTPACTSEGRVANAMVTAPTTHRSESKLEDIRSFFEDDHVHMALVVAADGRLLTTIERSDLGDAKLKSAPVKELGTLVGRTVGPSEVLDIVTAALLREGRRRLAVIDEAGRLLGLLCLKRNGTGYCSDESIRERASDRRSSEDDPGRSPSITCAAGSEGADADRNVAHARLSRERVVIGVDVNEPRGVPSH